MMIRILLIVGLLSLFGCGKEDGGGTPPGGYDSGNTGEGGLETGSSGEGALESPHGGGARGEVQPHGGGARGEDPTRVGGGTPGGGMASPDDEPSKEGGPTGSNPG